MKTPTPRHIHADMIIAKANNTNLVKLFKNRVSGTWEKPTNQDEMFDSRCEYLLCLPKHTEFCLDWLNGTQIHITNRHGWVTLSQAEGHVWTPSDVFMQEDSVFRKAPRKELRWIVALPSGECSPHFASEEELDEWRTVRPAFPMDIPAINIQVQIYKE